MEKGKGKEDEKGTKSDLLFLLRSETSCARAYRHRERTHFVTNVSFTVMM